MNNNPPKNQVRKGICLGELVCTADTYRRRLHRKHLLWQHHAQEVEGSALVDSNTAFCSAGHRGDLAGGEPIII